MGSFDPLADIITQRCEEHNWSGVLQSCPRCAERREHQEQIRQEERIQTNLLREANARAESERSQHERHEVVRQSEQHEREWADKRALQDARWEAEERIRQAREAELDHRRWVEEREDLYAHNPIEMTSCPCCGQPYASKRTVHKPFACHWVGRLESFIHEGVCPECHWKRKNAKEEVPWTQADWSSYYFLQISKAKTTDAILALIARVRPSGNDAIMLDARAHLSASLITDIGREKEIISSAVSIDELEKHEATINKYALQLENECQMRVSVEYQAELKDLILARREKFTQIQKRQQQDAELAKQQSALKQKQKDALSKVESARREFLNSQADLSSTESETISNSMKTSAILGMIGFFCGGFYGCVASGTTMLASGIKLGGIISLVSLFIFIVEARLFGRVAKARSRVRYTRRALDQVQLSLGRDVDTEQDAKLEYAIDSINSNRDDSFSNVKTLRSIAMIIVCAIMIMIIFSVWLSVTHHSHQEINKSNDNLSNGAKRNGDTLSESRYFRNDLYELLHTLPAFVGASSVAKSPSLSVKSMLDGNLLTAWNSRSGETIGTTILFEVPAYASVKRLKLTTGFTKSTATKDLYLENHRIRKIEIYRDGISIGQYMLNTNNRELQSVEIGTQGGKFHIVIKETVPGSNRAWHEVCISELEVWGQIPNDRPIVIQEPKIL